MIKLVYKPLSVLVSVLGGILAGAIFKRVWKVAASEEDAPKATDAQRGWREVLAATDGRPERRIAVQEYGRSNPELLDGFRARGAEVTAVRVYQWDLPEDTGPLREAARRVAAGEFGAALFTTSVQIAHLFQIAAEAGLEPQVRDGFSKMLVASIGPATSEALQEYGLRVDFEPSHPKMGVLVQEAAARVAALAKEK